MLESDLSKIFWLNRIKPRAILHIGANDGLREREYYALHCAGPVVYVEALVVVYARLKANVAKYPNHVALLACVNDRDGEKVPFNVADNGGQSSSMLRFGTHSEEHPDVKFESVVEMTTLRADTLLAKNGIAIDAPSFLCLDLQGCELKALMGMGELLDHFAWVMTEFNERELYKGCVLEPELDAYLIERGFEVADRWDSGHGWGDKLFRRKSDAPKGDLE